MKVNDILILIICFCCDTDCKLSLTVAVLCYHPREIDQVIVAFVILKNKYRNTKGVKDIEEYIKTKLKCYMKPEIAIVEEFKYTVSGKLDRQDLLEFYANCQRGIYFTCPYFI